MPPKIVLVGENLNAERFTPPALHVLHDVLREVGLRANEVSIVDPRVAAKEIVRLRPNVAVTLGDWAFKTLVPNQQLSAVQARGYLWGGLGGVKVLATVHPETARKSWVPFRVLLGYDFQRAKEESKDAKLNRPERRVDVVSSERDAESAVRNLLRARRLGADIENYDEQRIACVGFADSPGHAVVFPERYLEYARRVLESSVPKIFQNAQYDLFFLLSRNGIKTEGRIDDPLVAWHACYPELAGASTDNEGKKKGAKRTHKSLAFFGSLFTRDEWWKDYEFQSEHERYVLNGRDCCITFEVMEKIEGIIKQQNVRAIYEHMLRQIWPCVFITARGLRVDERLRQERVQKLEARVEEKARELNEVVLPLLERERDRMDLRLFENIEGVCKCCRHASSKQKACWSCEGFEKAPSKKELVERMYALEEGEGDWESMRKDDLANILLPTCRACNGAPRREWLEFNPNSSAQKTAILYDVLKLPKRFNDGALTADEDALKGLLTHVA